jgi:hypothetical protein
MPKNADNEIFSGFVEARKDIVCNVLIIKYLTSWLALGVILI